MPDAGRPTAVSAASVRAAVAGLPLILVLSGWAALWVGLLGQVLADPRVQSLSPAPAGHLMLSSALGRSDPAHLVLMPVRAEGITLGVVELGFVGEDFDAALVADLCTRSVELLGLAMRAALYRVQLQSMLEEARCQAEELQAQQEELRVNNEELEVQAQSLARQKAALQRAHIDLQQQTDALAAASRYKSEFLANMSHELRTPLNSALTLSRLLIDNRDATLNAEQIKYAQAIHDANNDLLALINDILDLSKVEAGHADLRQESVRLADLVTRLRATFEPLARDRQLGLRFTVADDAPATLVTDGQRLQQVLKNLLANALKFTRQGSVTLHIARTGDGQLQFDVVDTGLGIPADKHQVIFEAFRQADGSTSRQFGGTGLGLSISRELVQRMGGDITLRNAPGEGSTFSVRLPPVMPQEGGGVSAPTLSPAASTPAAATSDPSPVALPVALPVPAAPVSPVIDPVPAHSGRQVLMAVEDDPGLRDSLRRLLQAPQVEIHTAGSVAEALARLASTSFDCMVTDLSLPDGSGDDLIERMAASDEHGFPPVIVYTGRALSREEEQRLRRHSRSIIVKGARSPERLLDEVTLFLHSVESQLPEDRRRMLARSRERDAVLEGRTLLLAEDDVRNVFALTSVFEQHGLRLVLARNGHEAVAAVARHPEIDLVLMDIMMPEMDGLEAMRRIRAQPEFGTLPIIALTAKAMADDRQQCLAGCSHGEEVWSLAVLLHEEGLLERSILYATDIDAGALKQAEAGVFQLDRAAQFSRNYQLAGGRASLSDYWHAGHDKLVFDRALRRQIVFADHSLATDAVFSEVHLVSCRNVLIYFDGALQARAVGLFRDALVRRGFLGLGSRETLQFGPHALAFRALPDLPADVRWYQRT